MAINPFTCIDLFSGIGGFRLGVEALGGKCINFSEINRDAIESYCANFNETKVRNLGDITKVKKLESHDLLTAGVPCQSWSIAGRNLGFDDDRGQLWNDTLYLLNQSRPKAFIFENVKGLADPRNAASLAYILDRVKQAGYFAKHLVLSSSDYGVPQDRVRVYIVGFSKQKYLDQFETPAPRQTSIKLEDVLALGTHDERLQTRRASIDLFGEKVQRTRKTQGMNDFFLFNDIRNGPTTIHSWDLKPITPRQKSICLLLLRNRRKSTYGALDGNPLSLAHFKCLDSSITSDELNSLVDIGILKTVFYSFSLNSVSSYLMNESESLVFNQVRQGNTSLDALRECRELKLAKVPIGKVIATLVAGGSLICTEIRYEFKYTKISTGIDGINRIFLPRSGNFPTLVASDTNDYIALKDISATTPESYKKTFLETIFYPGLYRKISKIEACRIQGFPSEFILPEARARWMKLIGNSVSVPLVIKLIRAIKDTGCFSDSEIPLDFSESAESDHLVDKTPLEASFS